MSKAMRKTTNKGKPKRERAHGPHYDPAPTSDLPRRISMGRPSTFREELIDEIAEWCRAGATDHEIMLHFGIANSTLYRWRDMYPEFARAMDEGKAKFDERIERSFAERARGYTHMVEKVFSNGTRARVLEHVPAEPGAARVWLQQRGRFKPDSQLLLGDIDAAQPTSAVEMGVRHLALGALALLSAAAFTQEPQAATIEGDARRVEPEEIDDAEEGEQDDWDGEDFDIDPGEL